MLVLRWEFDVCSAIVDIGFSNIVNRFMAKSTLDFGECNMLGTYMLIC